jgi:hypothetical protein
VARFASDRDRDGVGDTGFGTGDNLVVDLQEWSIGSSTWADQTKPAEHQRTLDQRGAY